MNKAIDEARKSRDKRSTSWQIRRFPCDASPFTLFRSFRQHEAPFFLDSGDDYSELGRYSFMGADPFLQVTAWSDRVEFTWPETSEGETRTLADKESVTILDELLARYQVTTKAPFPFSGGAVGFFSYDLKDEFEFLPQIARDDLGIPRWRLAWYDGIIVYDHRERIYYGAACGMQADGECSATLARNRLDRLENIIANGETAPVKAESGAQEAPVAKVEDREIYPSVTRDRYLEDLKRIIEYIFAGDIYQANLTQRFVTPLQSDPWLLYERLRRGNPAPFAAFLPYPDFQVLCSSPERFIRLQANGRIETCPIKGTRPRGATAAADEQLARELLGSVKDRAELTMIIDLERNDLGRICKVGTVHVPELIRLEKYPTVWHLVSTVVGEIRSGILPSELLRALFPGGSITGAPKIRAMEIIEELEPTKRGVYTGSIGYLGFDGAWDLNIVIRTMLIKDGQVYLHAGGGIVADSQPETEYEETLHKAKALFTALEGGIK